MASASHKCHYTIQEVLNKVCANDSDFGTDEYSDDDDYIFLGDKTADDANEEGRKQADRYL